jgi:hypothetical protein
VGLLAEEFEPLTGRTLGNFPQAYSHVGLINCALNLSRQKGTVGRHHRLCDPKRWLSGEIERTISCYPRTIDFGSSDHQNNDYSKPCSLRNLWMWNMGTDPSYATGRFSRPIRFVLVNNRVPRENQHCALCNRFMEKGYVRDSQTRLIYCNTQCFAQWSFETAPIVKNPRKQVS